MDDNRKKQLEYVIGIDLGHGETSAALCPIQWDTEVELLEPSKDLDMGGNKKVLPSAITLLPNGDAYIGDSAFDPGILRQAKVRVCFKKAPRDINGEAEQLMIRFMKEVYTRILQNNAGQLTPTNHLVYIATPSGWGKETQSLYLEMAKKAGIPIGGVTKESRAAYVRALNDVTSGLGRNIEKGAIVFDMGSSTLDFTYMRKGLPALIDNGYDCGASHIEKTIFQEKEKDDESIQLFEKRYPALVDSLLFAAREVKEKVYFDQTLRVKKTINFDDIVENDEELEDEKFKLAFQPGELDEMLRNNGYMEMIRKAMIDFRQNYIPGEKIHGVFMTGGASRMDFLKELICECWGVEKNMIYRDNDPSLTISEGVAEVARMDLRTEGMDEGIEEAIARLQNSDDIYHSFIDSFGGDMYDYITTQVYKVITAFGTEPTDYSVNDLESGIDQTVKASSQAITDQSSAYLEKAVADNLSDIQKQVESVIKNYARNDATLSSNIDFSSISIPKIADIGLGSTMNEISKNISKSTIGWGKTLGSIGVGALLGILLGGPIGILLAGLTAGTLFGDGKKSSGDNKSRPLKLKERAELLREIDQKWDEMKEQIGNSIYNSLTGSQNIRTSINDAVKKILQEYKEKLKDARVLID